MHYLDRPTEIKSWVYVVMGVIAPLPQAEHLGQGKGSTEVAGKTLLRLEEHPDESMCLQSVSHNESELTCGTELMVRKVSGRLVSVVGRGKSGRARA